MRSPIGTGAIVGSRASIKDSTLRRGFTAGHSAAPRVVLEGVTFSWNPVPGATGYRVFRVQHKSPKTMLDRVTTLSWGWRKVQTLEGRFKRAMCGVILLGLYPSPTALNAVLHGHRSRNLNGRECVWRREVMKAVGLKLQRSPAWPYKSGDTSLDPRRVSLEE